MDFDTRYKQYLAIIEEWLEDVIPPEGLSDKEFPEKTIYEAMRYSLMSGGKSRSH
jgi:geranylgeranyl pyrophosphate synthase